VESVVAASRARFRVVEVVPFPSSFRLREAALSPLFLVRLPLRRPPFDPLFLWNDHEFTARERYRLSRSRVNRIWVRLSLLVRRDPARPDHAQRRVAREDRAEEENHARTRQGSTRRDPHARPDGRRRRLHRRRLDESPAIIPEAARRL